ncbi:MAG: L-glutamate gamma-semialdehyde dehydrogenase, partial [Planctomycetota bacterium]
MTDFTLPEQRKGMEQALARVAADAGSEIPLLIGGQEVFTGSWIESRDPSDPDIVLARVAKAGPDQLQDAISRAHAAFPEWSQEPAAARAQVLVKAAAILRHEKHDMSALMVREAGKSWPEADADTAETIDFLEFYAREMLRLDGPQGVTPYPGEKNHVSYIALGMGAIIPPWNFPCAILGGMTAAALVTGNSVVVKPSSDTPATGWKFVQILRRAGLPDNVLSFCPGSGSEIGDALVMHPKLRFVSFTGSREVGLRINELAARPQKGQIWIKRVLAEMGGKNAIIVDSDFDPDAAAEMAVTSAFGYQGQKCSAGSRLILMDDNHDAVVERVVARAREISVGPPADPSHWMGPVINAQALEKIQEYIKIGKQEGTLLCGGELVGQKGHFLAPTVFSGIVSQDRLGQEEIFGPVLACMRAENFEDALRIANDTEYGLTGSCLSKNRTHQERARRDFHVGNLYINRKCTGALVDVQPFGGFNMSGTNAKAGGRDYLRYFL